MMTSTQKKIAIGAGITVGLGGLAWMFWPAGADASTDKKGGGSGAGGSGAPKITQFTVHSTTTNRSAQTTVAIARTGRTQNAYNGGAIIHGFTAPNIYAYPPREWYLQEAALASLTRVQGDLVREGKSILIVDAYRSKAEQEKELALKPRFASDPLVSNHTKGTAVDIRIHDSAKGALWDEGNLATWGSQGYLASVMARHGWRQHPTEEWHFDYVG